jgi:hypothetical protein
VGLEQTAVAFYYWVVVENVIAGSVERFLASDIVGRYRSAQKDILLKTKLFHDPDHAPTFPRTYFSYYKIVS